MNNRGISITSLLGIVAITGIAIAGCGVNVTNSAATYNQHGQINSISKSSLQSVINMQILLNPSIKATKLEKKQILDKYIVYDHLLIGSATKKISKGVIDNLVKSYESGAVKKYYGSSQSRFNAEMSKLHLTTSDVYNYAKNQYILHNYALGITKNPTMQQQRYYYNHNIAQFTTATWRDLVVGTLQQANSLEREISKRVPWSTLAKMYSTDTNSKLVGGVYKNAVPAQEIKTIQRYILSLPINKVSKPFQTPFGYYIIQVLARKKIQFNRVQPMISMILSQQNVSSSINKKVAIVEKQANIQEGVQ